MSKHRTLQPFEGAKPQLGKDIFVAPNASVIGDVKLGDQSSVWYGAILRGVVRHPALASVAAPNDQQAMPSRTVDITSYRCCNAALAQLTVFALLQVM